MDGGSQMCEFVRVGVCVCVCVRGGGVVGGGWSFLGLQGGGWLSKRILDFSWSTLCCWQKNYWFILLIFDLLLTKLIK